ncbi:MAG: chemotaxis protein CheB [Rivularia sp. (in: Bacteria)]|nr:chemotaxis protein CheB [Rivularia sp. MS3]
MSSQDIMVIGASAGGVEALIYLVKHLPTEFNIPIVIVLHLPKHGTEVLSSLLNRNSKLPVSVVINNQAIETGKIYVAPPDRHVLVKENYLQLTLGPRENNHRPAIDPLFRSASRAFNNRVIAVLLTGTLDDGTAGLKAVKMRDGVAVVQKPEDAMYPGMPRNAIENVENIDYILPLSEIPAILIELANRPVESLENSQDNSRKSDLVELDLNELSQDDRPNKTSVFICPDCGGPLWEMQQQGLLRYRCRIGHAYSMESLLARKSDDLEDALWLAMRVLEEKASLSRKIATRMRSQNQVSAAIRLEEQEKDAIDRAKVIQKVIYQNNQNIGENTETFFLQGGTEV